MQRKDFYNLNIGENNIQTGGFYLEKLYFILHTVGSEKKVLDIGCNDGYVGEKLIARENVVYGIDISEKELKIARKKGLKVKKVDIENQDLPYPQGFFDVVILADVIEHVFDTDSLLKKSFRVLKKGGKLIVTTPNIASFGRRLMLLAGKSPFIEYSLKLSTNGLPSVGHIRYYTEATLRNQLKHNGFKNIEIEGDKVNFGLFRSRSMGRFLPSFSIMLMASCTK